jgi:disulfide bond formation protein DsbB
MQHHMTGWIERRTGNLLGVFACLGLTGYAYYAQYGLGLEPCPLCILQRVAVIGVGVLFLLAWLHNPGDRGARIYGGLIDLVAVSGIAVAARQIWIINQPPGSVAECGASLDYMMAVLPLHEVLAKVRHGCRQPSIRHIVAAELLVEAKLPQLRPLRAQGRQSHTGRRQ